MEADFCHPQNGHAEEVETDSHPPPLYGSDMANLRGVGQVEISDEATLEDLKSQVDFVHVVRVNTSKTLWRRITSTIYSCLRNLI